jgi:hypothetical protein
METLVQLAVFVANRPGTLASVCRDLADHDVNILGLAVADAVDHAVLRFVVDKAAVAVHVLGEAGLLVVESEVIAVRLPNESGRMALLGKAFSDAGVNIEYAYGATGGCDSGTLFLKVNDTARAREILAKLGL